MEKIKLIEQKFMPQKDIPEFGVGDTVTVWVKIPEGPDKVRLHPFQGTVIAREGSGIRATFTVRKIAYGEGIERVFPLYAPTIERIEVLKKGKVRRAKLYYLRGKIGKKAKIESIDVSAA